MWWLSGSIGTNLKSSVRIFQSPRSSLGLMIATAVLLLASVPQIEVVEKNASDWPGHQGEVSIAVDPSDPERVVAASMDLEDGRLLLMASADSGLNWHRTQIPVSPGAAYHADPMVDFDSRGRVFLAHIPVATGNHPVGIEVARSLDGGRTWAPSVRLSRNYDRDDKVALEVDDHESSPYRDVVYVAWKWPRGSVWFSRSLDAGVTFEEPRAIDSARVTGLDMTVDASGRLFLALYDHGGASIRVYRSDDSGLNFSQSTRVAPVRAGWYSAQPSHCRRLSLTHASIDFGPSPSGEVLYATWADYANGLDLESCSDLCALDSPCRTEVYFSLSRDQGRTWTEPITFAEEVSDRFFPWVSADEGDGSVYIAYKDTATAATRLGTDVFLARSNDCGLSFGPSVRLSSASSFATSADFQYGDYQGLDSAAGRAYAAWADYRAGTGASEIYVGRASIASRSGFRVTVGLDTVDLSYRFLGAESFLAEISVVTTSRYDGARRSLIRETRRIVPGEEVSLGVAREDLETGSRLEAEVASETGLGSKLRVWVDDLFSGASAGCR